MAAKISTFIDDEDESEFSLDPPETFVLSNEVNFRFHSVTGRNIVLSKSRHVASRCRPKMSIGECLVYGDKPLTGTAEMEVEVAKYDDSEQNSSLRIGVMRLRHNAQLSSENLPRYSEDGEEYCVWLDQSIYNNFTDQQVMAHDREERKYSDISLLQLGLGDRVGLHLSRTGDLSFLVNGKGVGVAMTGVYREGFRVYPVVDLIGKCCAIKMTRAGMAVFTFRKHINGYFYTS